MKRRHFLRNSALSAGAASILLTSCEPKAEAADAKKKTPLDDLQSMTKDVVPISVDERKARIEHAQSLMTAMNMDALFMEGGTNMEYFTGVKWGNSERMTAAIIPRKGEIKYVGPHFEEERLRELIKIGTEVRTWEEHESPYKLVAQLFKDLGIKTGKIGIEERVRFFLFDGIRQEANHLTYEIANSVTATSRMIKSAHEIELLQKANDVTLAAFKVAVSMLEKGMSQRDFSKIVADAHSKLGASGGTFCSFGKATAFPHGSSEPQELKEGDVVLMDGGCTVDGYESDITRTVVFGEPTKRQREVWDLEKKAQAAGFDAAKLGDPCENVDIAARKVIVDAGFGPGYKVPGLPHRTGHGIGMDGHEWGNMVLDNKTPLQTGMCFSIEPTISIYGEFGVRLEDCAYMTETGARWFTQPSESLDKPFA